MGDGADIALDNAMDDMDVYNRWEQNGSCPQEGYDLGILNERGGMEEFPVVSRNKKVIQCRHCGSTSVYWEKRGNKWIMFNSSNNQSHSCKEYHDRSILI
jgi:hypothetical protein